MTFEPIAIVGQSCIFPRSFTPAQFWRHIEAAGDLVASCPDGRWRASKETLISPPDRRRPDTAVTDRGGYVDGFARAFDPSGFRVAAPEITPLDEQFHWVLHTAREALRDARLETAPERTGAVLGLLGLPTEKLIEYAEAVWSGSSRPDARNRFSTGLPAELLAAALGLDRGAFALDAACASSLFALKFACDALHHGHADLMLAGAVSRADSLYIQVGFSALNAVSPTGRSRPFHRDADGLLPAEGAAFVVLKRFSDAVDQGDSILGVIRGIGIGNDGRGAGLMAPSADGQRATMRQAYEMAGLEPAQISLIECHATGTPVGDACELESTGTLFEGLRDVPIGSVKSNMGHAMTAAGMAGLLKILGAMRQGQRPATLHTANPSAQLDRLGQSPFRLITRTEPWSGERPRRAALSAFGFGGNNGHAIIEEWTGQSFARWAFTRPAPPRIAVIGIGAASGSAAGVAAVASNALLGAVAEPRMNSISLSAAGLCFPPSDLEQSTPSQSLALAITEEALSGRRLPARTVVICGSGIDPEIARLSLRGVAPPLTGSAVIGRLCNIEANRISSRYDAAGYSFALLADRDRDERTLDLACRALERGDADAAIAVATHIENDRVNLQAREDTVLPGGQADRGFCFLLKRLDEAEAAGERIYAVLDRGKGPADSDPLEAVLSCAHRSRGGAPWNVAADREPHRTESFSVRPHAASAPLPLLPAAAPRVFTFAADSVASLIAALRADRESGDGAFRVAIVAVDRQQLRVKQDRAIAALTAGKSSLQESGLFFRRAFEQPRVGFVFPGAAAALQGAGRSLIHAFPEMLANVCERAPGFASGARWLFEPRDRRAEPIEKLWATTVLTQCHAHLTRRMLDIRADAAIGMSSGETNALFAFDVWRDGDAFAAELHEAGLFTRHLGGELEVLNGLGWQVWLLSISEERMAQVLRACPDLRILAIHAPGEYLAAGTPAVAAQAAAQLTAGQAQRVDFDLVVHAPEARPFAGEWRRLHRRESFAPPAGVRFYQMAEARAFEPTADSVADALTAQVLTTIDFPRLIRRAWEDGIRVFLEHGPRGACSNWISRILAGSDFAAIPLDSAQVDSLTQAANAIAHLFVTGAQVDVAALNRRTSPDLPRTRSFELPAHFPDIPPEPLRRKQPALPAASPAPLFTVHAKRLAEEWSRYLDVAGGESHAAYLQVSARAFAAAVGGHTGSAPRSTPARSVIARPKFTREELEITASGSIPSVFGQQFAALDLYRRVVRLPMPPMLLADRIVSIDAEPAGMKTGSLIAETDIAADAWYMHRSRMAASIVIESGQADMLLISWLGIDLLLKGERVYRLLGCDLTWHSELPKAGDTLRYNIRVTGHARQGEVRLFFFEYDCHSDGRLIASVRNGQAGFFTEEELRQSAGIVWKPEARRPVSPAHTPRFPHLPSSYGAEQLRAAAAGDALACFGGGFEASRAQLRPPSFATGKLLMIERVAAFDPRGGPFGRGYLRAEYDLTPDHWVFQCHFKDDPCFPGTLMLEGAFQAMSFLLMAFGFTLERDGWRFEPLPGQLYPLRCRGQATPESKLMVCEVFVEEVVERPEPVLYAQVLGSVDGLKCFACTGMAVRLTPGHPLDDAPPIRPDTREVASVNGVRLDFAALMACAQGLPSQAFGEPYARFDQHRRCPRLPGPPYHLLHRITHIDGQFGAGLPGTAITGECDLRRTEWYFRDSPGSLAFAALLEAGLQPCGWISCFTGVPLRSDEDLFFRNLDGKVSVLAPVAPSERTLVTRAVLTNMASSGPITLTSFKVTVQSSAGPVLQMETTFGFFRREELTNQTGMAVTPEDRARLTQGSGFRTELTGMPPKYFAGALRLPTGDLRMIDRVVGLWEQGARAEKDVDASEWFFKAHFYGDPVQPGSLGIEAILQTGQFFAIENNLAAGLANPEFELLSDVVWKYRGQVLPSSRSVTAEVQVLAITREPRHIDLNAEGWLWVDGLKIYHMPKFTLRIREGSQ